MTEPRTSASQNNAATGNLPQDKLIFFYDGDCGLCHRSVRFLIKRDRKDRYRFIALQTQLAEDTLAGYQKDSRQLSTSYLLKDHNTNQARIYEKGRATVIAIAHLGRGWALVHSLRILPSFVLNLGYALVARNRLRLFGRAQGCPVPAPEHRHKFIAAD